VRTIRFCSVVLGVTSSLAVIYTIYRGCVQCESALGRSRAEESRRRWLYRAWRLVVEYPQYTTSDISLTTCEMVALVHRRPCLQHLACCSVNSRHINSESRFLPTPPAFDTPIMGGSCRNIAISFGTEKLEWCGCPTVKQFLRYLYLFWHNPRTWQAHRHRGNNVMSIFKMADLSHLGYEGSNNGFFEKPNYITSYRSSIDTIPLHCLVFEKIAFLHFGDRQTNRRTDGQHRCTKPLSLSRAAA